MYGSMRGLAALVVVILLVSVAAANGPRPPIPPNDKPIKEDMGKVVSSAKAQYDMVFDAKAKRVRLVIPQKFVTAAGKAPAKEAPRSSATGSSLMAGLALSLGLVTGGLWFARRGTGGLSKGKLALFVTIGVLGVSAIVASTVWADLAPFPKDKFKGPPVLGFPGLPKQDVDVEITQKGETIYLVMPGGNLVNPFGGPLGNPPPLQPPPKLVPPQEE